jgi:hypothetical protein
MAYTSQYPPAYNTTYVKVLNADYGAGHNACNPSQPLTGDQSNGWIATGNATFRFHIDLGAGKYIRRIYYENYHHNGGYTQRGVKNFTFWGTNSATAFAELTYGTDTDWTQLTIASSTFDIHSSSDAADPKYILVTNINSYQYYGFKFADIQDTDSYMGMRRIELQTEDGWSPPAATINYLKGRKRNRIDLSGVSLG